MAFSAMAGIGRVGRQVVTVGLLTLVFSALAASPASANQRGDAVNAANDFIYGCTANGGSPDVQISNDDNISVICFHENDSIQTCDWSESQGWQRNCWFNHPEVRSPDGDGLGVNIGDTIFQADAGDRQKAIVQVGGVAPTNIVADSGDPNDGEQGDHARKGKDRGKKHGKSKGHGKGNQRK